jgi:hypothetical protein
LFCIEAELLRQVNALTITDWRCRISLIVIAGLIVENNLAGLIVPDLESELVDAATVFGLTINHRQDVTLASLMIDLADTLKLRSRMKS